MQNEQEDDKPLCLGERITKLCASIDVCKKK